MYTLSGKRAVITGGANGIGKATVSMFAQEGASVVIVDIDAEQGQAAAQEISASGGPVTFIRADVSRAEDCRRVAEVAVQEMGGIDILFNNAGIIRRATVIDTTEDEWDRVMAVNVRSIFLMCRAVIPVMREAGGGAIVNTGSGWGLSGGVRAAAYCAAKGAVVNLTRALALDHGVDNIRVNCVCPGDTDTAMLRFEAGQLGEPEAVFLADAAHRPLRRIGKPEEIARAVLYLASEASSFVTGTTLVVDGGGLAG